MTLNTDTIENNQLTSQTIENKKNFMEFEEYTYNRDTKEFIKATHNYKLSNLNIKLDDFENPIVTLTSPLKPMFNGIYTFSTKKNLQNKKFYYILSEHTEI